MEAFLFIERIPLVAFLKFPNSGLGFCAGLGIIRLESLSETLLKHVFLCLPGTGTCPYYRGRVVDVLQRHSVIVMPDDVLSHHSSGEVMAFFGQRPSGHLDRAEERRCPYKTRALRVKRFLHEYHGYKILSCVQDEGLVYESFTGLRSDMNEIGQFIALETLVCLEEVLSSLICDLYGLAVQKVERNLIAAVHHKVKVSARELKAWRDPVLT